MPREAGCWAQVLDFFLEALGPRGYNQAVQDARGFMMRKLDDLDGEVHEPEASRGRSARRTI
jgi:uncharacterized protein (DUF2164 family)